MPFGTLWDSTLLHKKGREKFKIMLSSNAIEVAWREKWIIWLLLQIPPILCSPKLLEAWGKDPADQNTFTQVTKSIGGQKIGGI